MSFTIGRKYLIVIRHVTKLLLLVDQRALIKMGIPEFSIYAQLFNPGFGEGDPIRNDVEVLLFF